MDNKSNKLLNFSWILKKGHEKSLEEVLSKYDLSQNEGSVLLFLYNNKLDTAKEISEYRSISKSLVSKSINNLYSRGYIGLIEDKKDKRINRLYITKSAKEIVTDLHLAQENFYTLLQKDISEEDLKLMNKILKKLYNNIYKEINNKF